MPNGLWSSNSYVQAMSYLYIALSLSVKLPQQSHDAFLQCSSPWKGDDQELVEPKNLLIYKVFLYKPSEIFWEESHNLS